MFIDAESQRDNELIIEMSVEVRVRVIDIRNAARHAGPEVAADRTKYDYGTAGHVFATMIANALDHRQCTTVSNRKAFTCASGNEQRTARCSIQNRVTNNVVFVRGITKRRIVV